MISAENNPLCVIKMCKYVAYLVKYKCLLWKFQSVIVLFFVLFFCTTSTIVLFEAIIFVLASVLTHSHSACELGTSILRYSAKELGTEFCRAIFYPYKLLRVTPGRVGVSRVFSFLRLWFYLFLQWVYFEGDLRQRSVLPKAHESSIGSSHAVFAN